ncbi:hypothetical protein BH23DEI1_BH23DEI1_07730 [soil metagenome]
MSVRGNHAASLPNDCANSSRRGQRGRRDRLDHVADASPDVVRQHGHNPVEREGAAGETLAQLVNGGRYWIGVALDGGLSLGGTRTIAFDEGWVTLTF